MPAARCAGDVSIRELETDDLPALTVLVRSLLPTMVVSERGLDHMRKSTRWWVADDDGEIVAAGRAGRFGRCWIGVAPPARGRGLGAALAAHVERDLREAGHAEAVSWTDDDAGAGFAGHLGFEEVRRKPISVLRLGERELPPLEVPPGVELVPLVDLPERLRELHALAMSAHADDPADPLDSEQSFEEWLRDDLGVPDLEFLGSTVAVVDGQLAALAFIASDGVYRAENEFTGTHPDFRGRGLATLVKLSTIHWAASKGLQEIWTGNDSENAPMLAINRKLGYEPAGARRKHVKRLEPVTSGA
jgi:GNAT superfamily N-acetyltransferase